MDVATVKQVARLARLHLDESEVTRMTDELEAILGLIAELATVDTRGVEPVAQIASSASRLRDDRPGPMLPVEQVLANAPASDGQAFLVPKAVER